MAVSDKGLSGTGAGLGTRKYNDERNAFIDGMYLLTMRDVFLYFQPLVVV